MSSCLKYKSVGSHREPMVYIGNGDYKLTRVKTLKIATSQDISRCEHRFGVVGSEQIVCRNTVLVINGYRVIR